MADVQPRALAGSLEQRRHVVVATTSHQRRAAASEDLAVAGRDIEHLLSGAQVHRLAKLLADNLQRGGR